MSNEPIAVGSTNKVDNSFLVAHTPRMAKPWNISELLITYIGEWESGVLNGINFMRLKVTDGMILAVYLDSRKLPTVGLGHLVKSTDNLKLGDVISLERANKLFIEDLRVMETAVNAKVNVPLYQYEYDALVDIAFNAGEGGGIDGIAKIVNAGDYSKVPNFVKTYRTGGGNIGRRASEANLFKYGEYDATH
jgi:lysozyme